VEIVFGKHFSSQGKKRSNGKKSSEQKRCFVKVAFHQDLFVDFFRDISLYGLGNWSWDWLLA